MLLNRRFTNRVNWILDNCLPPVLRDAPWLMRPLMRLVLGPLHSEYERFKPEAAGMSAAEYRQRYRSLASTFLARDTDLSPGCAQAIRRHAVGRTVLDAGCGRGYLSRLLAEAGFEVTATDIAPPAGLEGARTVAADIEQLPFLARAFDTVVSTHTLEHVLDPEAALAELRRVTRRRLILVVPRQRPYRFTFDLHLNYFPYAWSLRNFLGDARARVEVIDNDLFAVEDLE